MGTVQIVLTSAGAAAFVSAVVSGLMAAWREKLERSARLRERLLRQAHELATYALNASPQESNDPIVLIERYYKLLRCLDRDGKLPHHAVRDLL